MAKKRGRPKRVTPIKDIFVGIRMPKELAVRLSKDAEVNYRARAQQILWVLTEYIDAVDKAKPNDNHINSIYTEEEVENMYNNYKKSEGEL